MTAVTRWLQQLDYEMLLETVVIVAASLLCITFHETCHGLVAYWLGDDTAKRMGRLTLNPLRHVDIMGLIVMAVAKFGWAKAVPVDMRRFKNPKTGMALTALAGPLSNVLLAFLALLIRGPIVILYFRAGEGSWIEYGVLFLEYVAILSTGLAVFNLFPIPPLDGSKIAAVILPQKWYYKLMRFERFGMLLLAALLFLNVLDMPLMFLRQHLLSILMIVPNALTDFWINLLL